MGCTRRIYVNVIHVKVLHDNVLQFIYLGRARPWEAQHAKGDHGIIPADMLGQGHPPRAMPGWMAEELSATLAILVQNWSEIKIVKRAKNRDRPGLNLAPENENIHWGNRWKSKAGNRIDGD